MAVIWQEADRRWGNKVRLQARKALAHPGKYQGTDATTKEYGAESASGAKDGAPAPAR